MEGISHNIIFDQKNTLSRQQRHDVWQYNLITAPLHVILALIAFFCLLGAVLASVLGIELPLQVQGILYILAALLIAWWLLFVFASIYLPRRYPTTAPEKLLATHFPQGIPIFQAVDFHLLRAARSINPNAEKALHTLLHRVVRSKQNQRLLERFQLSSQKVGQNIEEHVIPHTTYQDIWYNALNIAVQEKETAIHTTHILAAFLLHPALKAYLREQGLRLEDIAFFLWWMRATREQTELSHWWREENLLATTGVGISWAAGYTPLVDRFGYIPAGDIWDIPFAHEQEVENIITSLARRRQSNVLLVGAWGSGRLGIIKAVATRILRQEAHPALRGERVVYVHIGQLLGLAKNGPEQIAICSRILDEMERAGNIIAVLDGIGTLLGSPSGDTVMTDIIAPFFSSAKVRVITIMSSDEYHTRLKTNDEIAHLFEVVQVEPLSPQQTLQMMALVMGSWEKLRRIHLPYQAMREIVDITATILPQVPFPEKAFDILEELTVAAQAQKQRHISLQDVQDLITKKVGVPVGKIEGDEANRLLGLADFIHQRVVNQVKAVQLISQAMIRARAGVRNTNKPIGTFLFLGPTGVGKTETAKALAEAYFGSEESLVRIDMSEYQDETASTRLLGTMAQPSGVLTAAIGDHPFCVVLLDEFEKANRAVQQLFLPVFDEGYINDARGQLYSFKHTIIIATSNAGAEFIRQHVDEQGHTPANFDTLLREEILSMDVFRPELVNRFDGVVTFTPLLPEHIKEVARFMLKKLNKQLDRQHGVTVEITEELLQFLVAIGYDADFGARPMARAIQNTVEYALAQQILRQQTVPGQIITLDVNYLKTLQV